MKLGGTMVEIRNILLLNKMRNIHLNFNFNWFYNRHSLDLVIWVKFILSLIKKY